MEYHIRSAAQSDVKSIVELWKEMFDLHKERDSHFTRSSDGHENYEKLINEGLASDDYHILVAETDKKIIGYCLANVAKYPPSFELKEYGAIFDLSVTRNYRRKSLGEKLLKEAYNWFSKKGIKRIEARVATSNDISQKFWRKMGFAPYMEILFLEKNMTE